MQTIIAVLAGASVTLFVLGAFRPNRVSAVRRRVEELEGVAPIDPYAQSFAERVVAPFVRALARLVSERMPGKLIQAVDATMETAGMRMTVSTFMSIWATLVVLVPLATLGLVLVGGGTFDRFTVIGLLFWTAMWAYLPWFFVRRRAAKRARRIDRKLPDAIDLIVTSVEAGLGLQAAMLMVAEKFEGPIGEEFTQVVRETSLGRARSEALNAMATRAGSRDLSLFARAVNQAEQMGISISEVLRNQAAEVRDRRRQYAREQAAKIPVKLTIPTIMFIFPTLFLILLGPVALSAVEKLGGR